MFINTYVFVTFINGKCLNIDNIAYGWEIGVTCDKKFMKCYKILIISVYQLTPFPPNQTQILNKSVMFIYRDETLMR